jgi:NADPH2:quinone reductase
MVKLGSSATGPPPFVPGMDTAGIIDKVGADSDRRLVVGDPVVALALPAGPRGGAYADQIVAPSASVVRAPTGVTLTAVATLPLNRLAVVADAAPADTELVRGLGADVVVARGEQVAVAIRAAVPAGVSGLVDAANQQALVLGANADGGGLAEVAEPQPVTSVV